MLMRKLGILLLGFFCFQIMAAPAAHAATSNSYKQTNLVSDTAGTNVDPKLKNPWGIAFLPGAPFWIADNNSGFSTLYDKTGASGAFSVTIPPPAGSSHPATPTGIVVNTGGGFKIAGNVSLFIFDTEDGTISGWHDGPAASIAVDNSTHGAVYKGLALITNANGTFLLAANFNSGNIDVFDGNFNTTHLAGGFTDPNIPAGYAPFAIHLINGQLVVTYALQDAAKHDPVHAPGAGYVDLFNLDGVLIQNIVPKGGMLNAPWGAAIAPAGFGSLAGDLLIGNFGDGTISAFDPRTFTFIDQMKDANGAVIVNTSLWELLFDTSGQTGDPNTLYFTAGLDNEAHGLFGTLTANVAPPAAAPDFSVDATPKTLTISAGQSASFTVTAAGMNGFNAAITLSCSGQPAGTTCKFSPATLSPASGATATSMLAITTNSGPYNPHAVMKFAGLFITFPITLMGVLLAGSARRDDRRKRLARFASTLGLIVVATGLLVLAGCGGYGGGSNGTPKGTSTVVITGTSGTTTHSASVTLTVQ
jgi:uncharacterized protein (TIGR03118 family)